MNTSVAETRKPSQNFRNAAPRTGANSVKKPSDERKEVVFEFDATSANEVWLAGDFTDWEKTPIKLRKGERGRWQTKLMLAPGQYHYKFVVDGQWQDDPLATGRRANPFGTCDSILKIS